METLKVSSTSNPNSVAGMIAAKIKEGYNKIPITCVGAGALNQTVKSIAVARGYLAPSGMDLICVPSFTKVTFEESDDRTGIKFIVEMRKINE